MKHLTSVTIIFLFCTSVFSSCSSASTKPAKNISVSSSYGIAKGDTVKTLGRNLMRVFQDSKNNYWFASDSDGVYRYNEKTIVHFTIKDGLCQNKITDVQEDKSGNLFFNTDVGISKYDGNTFTTLPITNSNEWKLLPDDLWFKGAQDSGVVYRYDGKKLHRLKFPPIPPGEEHIKMFPRSAFPFMTFSPYDVYIIYKDSRGHVWFGTSTLGVCRYDGKSFTWISESDLEFDVETGFGIRSILEDRNGKFWFSNTLYTYNVHAADSTHTLIPSHKEKGSGNLDGDLHAVISMTKDNRGNTWFATLKAGIYKYDGKNLTHYPVTHGKKAIMVFSIFNDREGTLWLGTHANGVYKFNGKRFERFIP